MRCLRSQFIESGVIVFFLFVFGHANAQWTLANGPPGGLVTAIAITSNNNVAAGTLGGLYLSSNNGSSWSLAAGVNSQYVTAITAIGSNIFVGTFNDLFVSHDNGTSWSANSLGPTNSLLVIGDSLFAGAGSGVFLSIDHGISWTSKNSGITGFVMSFALSENYLFAATYDGVFRSADRGESWTLANTGLTTPNDITRLIVSNGNVFAGSDNGKLFRSANDGASWSLVHDFFLGVQSMATTDELLFIGTSGGGISLSFDDGDSWTPVFGGLINFDIRCITVSGSTLFAGTGAGVFTSSNAGGTWTSKNAGISASYVRALCSFNNSLFASAWTTGIAKSIDHGLNWTGTDFQSTFVGAMAVHNNNLFVGAYGGIFKYNGVSWTSLPSNTSGQNVNALASHGNNLFVATTAGISLSPDNGASWTTVNSGLTNLNIASLAVKGDNLFAGTTGGGIFISTDDAQNWTPVNAGLTNYYVNSFAVRGDTIFAGTDGGGVAVSFNNGALWHPRSQGLSNQNLNVTSLLFNGGQLFAGTYSGVVRSNDDGQNWVTDGLDDIHIYALLVDGNMLLAGTGAGLYLQNLPSFPVISGFTPTYGAAGSSVTITGTNFNSVSGQDSVWFNGTNAKVTDTTASTLTVVVPVGAATGPIEVSVNNQSTTSSTNFTVGSLAVPVAIHATNISMAGFTANWRSVLGVVNYRLDVSTDNFVTFAAGYNSATETDTSVVITNLSVSSQFQYRVRASDAIGTTGNSNIISIIFPKITGFAPAFGLPGTSVVITGANFSNLSAQDSVWFNGTKAKINNATSTTLTVLVPSGAITGTIQVSVNDVPTTSATNFTVASLYPPVAIDATNLSSTGFTANWRSVGNALSYQLDVSTDNFGTFISGYDAVSETDTAVVITNLPASSQFQYRIRALASFGTSGNSNIISVNFPKITGFTPTSGAVGSSVIINGFNFGVVSGQDSVWFNGTSAQIISSTSTSLTVVVPAGATTGPIKVSVGNLSITSSSNFTVKFLSAPIARQATNLFTTGFTANWGNVDDASAYQLDVSIDTFKTFIPGYNSTIEHDTSAIVNNLPAIGQFQYRVRASADFGMSDYSNIISTIITETIDHQKAATLFPNPADHYFQIAGVTDKVDTSQLFDLTGRGFPVSMEIFGDNYRFSIQHLPAGFYYLEVISGASHYQFKFVKK